MRLPIVEQVFGSNKAPITVVLETDFADLTAEVEEAISKAEALPGLVKSEQDLGTIGSCIADIRALAKKLDGVRVEEGRPLLDATKSLNEFFKGLAGRLSDVTEPLQRAADDYARRKAAEERAKREQEAAEARRREEEARRKAEKAKTEDAAILANARVELASANTERAEQEAAVSAADLVRTRTNGVTASAKTEWSFRIANYAAIDLNALRPYLARADVEKAIRSMVRIQKGDTSLPGVEVFEDIKSTFRR
jgi:flagellar biosynthesis GTPase FlhF